MRARWIATFRTTRARLRCRWAACSCWSAWVRGPPTPSRFSKCTCLNWRHRGRHGWPIRPCASAPPTRAWPCWVRCCATDRSSRRCNSCGSKPLQREPGRLTSRFDAPVKALKACPRASRSMPASPSASTWPWSPKAVFSPTRRARPSATTTARPPGSARWSCRRDAPDGVAYERFTRNGPVALLPLTGGRAALVWCVASNDDPVAGLDDSQRLAVLNTLFHPAVGTAARHLASQALRPRTERRAHPRRGPHRAHRQCGADASPGGRSGAQPRDCATPGELVHRLRSTRRPGPGAAPAGVATRARPLGDDRRHRFPGPQLHLDAARRRPRRAASGLAALQALGPVKSALARRMMYGSR